MLSACLVGLDWASCSTEHCQALWATQGEAGGCFVPEPQLPKTRPISDCTSSIRKASPAHQWKRRLFVRIHLGEWFLVPARASVPRQQCHPH